MSNIDPVMLRNNAALVANAARIFNVSTIPHHGCGKDFLRTDVRRGQDRFSEGQV